MPSSGVETFRLYLVRHAHAAWGSPGVSDFDRPLDELGHAEARDVAEQAVLWGFVPDMVISSPARRCRETTSALLKVLPAPGTSEDMNLYADGPEAYFAQIRSHQHRGSLMIVGHNPMIEAVAQHISKDCDVMGALALGYPTAAILVIDFDLPVPDSLHQRGRPVSLITPTLT